MSFETFDLNLLRSLDALLRERNVTRAAEQIHVTQQAMSGTLKRLRQSLNDALLVPVGRHLEPTPLATAMAGPVRDLILQIELVLATTPRFEPMLTKRRFKIAMSDYATVTLLPLLMAQLSRTAPGIVCDIKLIDDVVFGDLDAGELDFGLLPENWRLFRDAKPASISSHCLFADDFVCVLDENNSVGAALTLEGYLALPHNMVRLGSGVRSIVDNAWQIADIAPAVAATTTSFTSLISMVPGTKMVATVQRRLAMSMARALPIRIYECPIPVDRLIEELSWHRRYEHDPAHRFMRETFVTAAALLN